MTSQSARSLAAEALDVVPADPARARRLGRHALRAGRLSGDAVAQSLAERAWGVADVHLGHLTAATAHLERAVALVDDIDRSVAADARVSLAFALTRRGELAGAVGAISRALPDLTGARHAAGLAQRAAIQQQLGHLDAAAQDYAAALPVLQAAGDRVRVQRILSNRGVLHAFRHEYVAAEEDLRAALLLCRDLDLRLGEAYAHENLLLVYRRTGDIERALRHLMDANRLYRDLGMPVGSLLMEKSELLGSTGRWEEAREAAEGAVAEFRRTRRRLSVPEARLLVGLAALRSGEPRTALRQAALARRQLAAQGRTRFVALGEALALSAAYADPGRPDPEPAEVSRAAPAVDGAGWPEVANDLRLMIGRRGPGGDGAFREVAERELMIVARSRRRGPAPARVRGWYASALLHRWRGEDGAAARDAARGLAVLEEFRATVHATDLRASLSTLGLDLAAIGLGHAVRRSPRQLFAWAERSRARQPLWQPAPAAPDSEVGRCLSELRSVAAQVEERRRAGEPSAGLIATQVALERQVRDLGRLGRSSSRTQEPWSWPRLLQALGDDALVQYVDVEGVLYAVTVADGRVRRTQLCAAARVAEVARWFPFGLGRLAAASAPSPATDAAAQLVYRQAGLIDELVLRPLQRVVGGRRLVVIPTDPLHGVPWALLPRLRGVAVTVAPSAALWLRSVERAPSRGHVVVVAGPGLREAREEARAVAAIHGVREPLIGLRAGHRAVTAALSGARLAHIAAHGHLRRDNPLLSSISLADGPVTVYDLEQVVDPAETVVLAACDVGASLVLAGDELLGLASGFLTCGTREVVASVVPVPDAATAPLMVALHRRLADGSAVAQALADAQCEVDPSHPAAVAAAAGFLCLGAGWTAAGHDAATDHDGAADAPGAKVGAASDVGGTRSG